MKFGLNQRLYMTGYQQRFKVKVQKVKVLFSILFPITWICLLAVFQLGEIPNY